MRQKVCVLKFGSSTTDNHSVDSPKYLHHAISIWGLIIGRFIQFSSQCTDAGSGDTGKSLQDGLMKLGRFLNDFLNDYYTTSLTVHTVNFILRVPVKE